MDKIQCCASILEEKGLSPKAIHENMVKSYEENALSYTMIEKWSAKFRRETDSIENYTCPGRLATARNQEMIARVHDHVVADWQLSGA